MTITVAPARGEVMRRVHAYGKAGTWGRKMFVVCDFAAEPYILAKTAIIIRLPTHRAVMQLGGAVAQGTHVRRET